MTEQMVKDSQLLSMNPLLLIFSLALLAATAFFCARHYRNTSDFKKSVKLYIPFAVVEMIVCCVIGAPIMISLGCGLAGFGILMWVSNHYFYDK